MTGTVTTEPGFEPRSAFRNRVAAARPVSRSIFTRKSRWKRRGPGRESKRIYRLAGLGIAVFVSVFMLASWLFPSSDTGPGGVFARSVAAAFPEAEAALIETVYANTAEHGELPKAATVYLPEVLLGSRQDGPDPFAKLRAEFGAQDQGLPPRELGRRVEQVAATALGDVPRCQTYEIGGTRTDASQGALRALHIYLNPGC